jgi:hypothetical protein
MQNTIIAVSRLKVVCFGICPGEGFGEIQHLGVIITVVKRIVINTDLLKTELCNLPQSLVPF